MTLPRDRLLYSSPFTRPPLRLPGDARMVVWSVVNVEEWEITRPMARLYRHKLRYRASARLGEHSNGTSGTEQHSCRPRLVLPSCVG